MLSPGDLDVGCEANWYNHPPYPTTAYGHELSDRTVCADAVQVLDTKFRQTALYDIKVGVFSTCLIIQSAGRHYDLHNLYGWYQSPPTLEAVRRSVGGRGLVLSRSTFPGSGRSAAHWLGDNWSLWSNLKFSIIGMLQFNQFGMPQVGENTIQYSKL